MVFATNVLLKYTLEATANGIATTCSAAEERASDTLDRKQSELG